MTILDKYRHERDANGELTWLAIAIDAAEEAECDCGGGDPPCAICACEEALIEVVEDREALRAEIRALRESSDYYERLADDLNQQIGGTK